MNDLSLLNYLRGLADSMFGANEVSDLIVDSLEEIQAVMEAKYADYEDRPVPSGAEQLRDMMMEALKLIHDGVEEFLLFTEDFRDKRLARGVAMLEEGHDILDAVHYAAEQDCGSDSAASIA